MKQSDVALILASIFFAPHLNDFVGIFLGLGYTVFYFYMASKE